MRRASWPAFDGFLSPTNENLVSKSFSQTTFACAFPGNKVAEAAAQHFGLRPKLLKEVFHTNEPITADH